jgi:hypothetical protein
MAKRLMKIRERKSSSEASPGFLPRPPRWRGHITFHAFVLANHSWTDIALTFAVSQMRITATVFAYYCHVCLMPPSAQIVPSDYFSSDLPEPQNAAGFASFSFF